MNFLFSKYKWHRKLIGGLWFKNRYIFDLGRGLVFIWERKPSRVFFVDKEDYNETKYQRRKRIINEIINVDVKGNIRKM